MAGYPRGGKLTVLNPVPPIRRVWRRASELPSAKSQPNLSFCIRLPYRVTLYRQGDSYRLHLKGLQTA
jgi:hypothetical protein